MNTLFRFSYEMALYGEATEIVRNFTFERFTRTHYVLREQNIKTGPLFLVANIRKYYTPKNQKCKYYSEN